MRMADDDRFAKEGFEWVGDGREPWCIGDEGFGNAMHGHGGLRNAATGIDETSKALHLIQFAAFEARRANLHKTCLPGVQPCQGSLNARFPFSGKIKALPRRQNCRGARAR